MTARASAPGLRRAAGRGGTGDARPKIGDHAVVLGASMSGLLAARVLADAYQQVTVVERDVLADSGMPRKGVPQGRHAHALLPSVLDDLFPGFLAGLVAEGVPMLSNFRQLWFSAGGHLLCQDGKPDDPAYLASRPYLESQVRRRSGPCPTS
jgi:2-polyprenyl-6-methoxyphenol hydroxylase-like FAD-dependent oxidoreductase